MQFLKNKDENNIISYKNLFKKIFVLNYLYVFNINSIKN